MVVVGYEVVLVIVGVAVFLFGAPRVKGWARALAEARREFDSAGKAIREQEEEKT